MTAHVQPALRATCGMATAAVRRERREVLVSTRRATAPRRRNSVGPLLLIAQSSER